jgi:hypothetical protein
LPVGDLTVDEEIAAEVKAFKKRKQAEIHEGIQQIVGAKRCLGSEDLMPLPLTDGVAEAAMPLPLLDGGLQAAGAEEPLPLRDGAASGILGKEYGILGKELGILGGRKRKGEGDKKSKRDETFGVQSKLKLCMTIDKLMAAGKSQDEALRIMHVQTARPMAQLRKVLKDRKVFAVALEERGFNHKGLLPTQAQLPKYLRKCKRKRFEVKRAIGAGVKSQVTFLYPVVKAFFEDMRAGGHFVDKKDFVEEFMIAAEVYLGKLEAKAETQALSAVEKMRQMELQERLKKLASKVEAVRYLGDQLQEYLGARCLKPQRVMTLSPAEEQARLEATWQHLDFAMWCLLKDDKWIEDHFAKPEAVKEFLKMTALLFSDQVPFWVKVTAGKQMFAADERRQKTEKNPKPPEAMSQKLDAQNEAGTSSKMQMRGQGISEQDRYRVTLELTHAVEDYFNSPEVPKGRVLPSALVLLGSHGRLDNLSDEGTFLKDEAFVWRGKEVVRRAGSSARGLLSSWVQLRIVSRMTFIDVQLCTFSSSKE